MTSRYASAEELANDLDRYPSGEPILARTVTVWERQWRWCRRNPALAFMATAISLLILLAAIGSSIAALVFQSQRNQLLTQQKDIEDANREAKVKLAQSYLDQARSNRMSGQVGQRVETLRVLKKAVRLAKELRLSDNFFAKLRNEAIAALALPDIQIAGKPEVSAIGTVVRFDAHFMPYALWDNAGISVRNAKSDQEICRIPSKGDQRRTVAGCSSMNRQNELPDCGM